MCAIPAAWNVVVDRNLEDRPGSRADRLLLPVHLRLALVLGDVQQTSDGYSERRVKREM